MRGKGSYRKMFMVKDLSYRFLRFLPFIIYIKSPYNVIRFSLFSWLEETRNNNLTHKNFLYIRHGRREVCEPQPFPTTQEIPAPEVQVFLVVLRLWYWGLKVYCCTGILFGERTSRSWTYRSVAWQTRYHHDSHRLLSPLSEIPTSRKWTLSDLRCGKVSRTLDRTEGFDDVGRLWAHLFTLLHQGPSILSFVSVFQGRRRMED